MTVTRAGSGQNSVPSSSSIDRSRVLDVKPLRSLAPVFPSVSHPPPFFSSPSSGLFTPGFCSFYPFSILQPSHGSPGQNQNQQPAPASPTNQEEDFPFSQPTNIPPDPIPAPFQSYRIPKSVAKPLKFSGVSNGDTSSSMENIEERMSFPEQSENVSQNQAAPRLCNFNVSQKKAKRSQDAGFSLLADGGKSPSKNFIIGFSSSQRDDGDWEMVNYVLMTFDALRRRLTQVEDAKEAPTGVIKRADLKSANILMSKGFRTNMRKRVGVVPGVEIGDIFFFRMEMCLVGLHYQSMAGIDYVIDKSESVEKPLALSIVSSGGYDDDMEDSEILIYSGQGGNINKKDKQVVDQKLERGNLALESSLREANEVRVIRGVKYAMNTSSKVYIYDGLYTIQDSWMEKGKSGCNIFKYKLVRIPGQPAAFALWKSIQKWKEGFLSRTGLILRDITSGAESIPVSLVNDVDDEKGPAYFTYFPTLKYLNSFKVLQPSFGCDCHSACLPGDLNCSCIRKNGGDFPYIANSILVSRKPLVYECGPTCPCFPDCKNRVSQTGLKVHLEVFKTNDRGWGLRSLDPIRAGTFICEYAGEVIDYVKVKQSRDNVENFEYVFDTTRILDHSFQWNCEPGLLDEETSTDANEDYKIPSPLIISAKNIGNVARFMNHSCSPNVFWEPVLYEHNHESFVHVAFFAIRHIPPMAELTYDYGITRSEKYDTESINIPLGKRKCLCGSLKCRGYFG